MSEIQGNEEGFALPEGSLVAKLDNMVAIQDYAPESACIRLIGVSEADFESASFNERRAEVFLVDVGIDDIWRTSAKLLRQWRRAVLAAWNDRGADGANSDLGAPEKWVRIRYERSSTPTSSYGYCLFREQTTPTYLQILDIEVFDSTQVVIPPPQVEALPLPLPQALASGPLLQAFHVGQGMCSLIIRGDMGILMDCGAGTPIKRPAYTSGAITNELATTVANVAVLAAVISHADSDHWRLLDWDAALAAQVQVIAIPSGIGMLAFTSPALALQVVGIGDCSLPLGAGAHLDLLRTQPSVSDPNGCALVAHLYTDTVRALLPGDYVYARFATDGNPGIQGLLTQTFDAVVAPHHGCKASAHNVPAASVPGRSQAFFSAGDHGGYRHPRFDALHAHSAQDFRIINDRTARHVWSHVLLP